jgi:dolichol-phosphate mannosyltransferase
LNKSVILIPTYNESENIEKLIRKIKAIIPQTAIFVIDDNSPDGTAKIVRNLENEFLNLHLIFRKKKEGLGAAYINGVAIALKNNFDYIIMMDSDFSHDPSYIPIMLNSMKKFDVVIGSRYIKGGCIKNWPIHRKIMSFIANFMIRILLGSKVKDSTSGFRCIKSEILKKIDCSTIHSQGYSFLYEMLWRIERQKIKIKEIPITFVDRKFGQTKISQTEIFKAANTLIKLIFK